MPDSTGQISISSLISCDEENGFECSPSPGSRAFDNVVQTASLRIRSLVFEPQGVREVEVNMVRLTMDNLEGQWKHMHLILYLRGKSLKDEGIWSREI